MENNSWFIFSLILFILNLSILGYILYEKENYSFLSSNSPEPVGNVTECENLSIKETVKCLTDYVSVFYNYTLRDESKYKGDEGSFEDIVKNGGDCHDYTKMYSQFAKQLNLNYEQVTFFDKAKKSGHTFIVIYDDKLTQYCNIDMLYFKCYNLGEKPK